MTNEEWLKSQDKEILVDMLAHSCKCCYYNYDNILCDTCEDGITKWLSMEHSEAINNED